MSSMTWDSRACALGGRREVVDKDGATGRHARLERALTPARAPAPAADTEPDELGRSLSEMEDMMARLKSRPGLRGPSAVPSLEMDS